MEQKLQTRVQSALLQTDAYYDNEKHFSKNVWLDAQKMFLLVLFEFVWSCLVFAETFAHSGKILPKPPGNIKNRGNNYRLRECLAWGSKDVFLIALNLICFLLSHMKLQTTISLKKNQPLRQNHKNTKTEGDFGFPTLKALSSCFFTWVLLLFVLLFEQQTFQGNFLRSDRSPHGHTGTRAHEESTGTRAHEESTGTRAHEDSAGTRGIHGHTRNPRAHEESTGTRAQESTKLSNMTESWQHCGGRTASPQKGIYGSRSHRNAWRNDLRSRQTTTLRCAQTTAQESTKLR